MKRGFVIVIILALTAACFWLPHYQLTPSGQRQGNPGLGSYNFGVVPTRWLFRYREPPHHVQEVRLLQDFLGFNSLLDQVQWQTNATFRDAGGGDPFNWYAQFAIFALPRSYMKYGRGPIHNESSGGPHVYPVSYTSSALRAFASATVVLTGWRFGFWDDDQHLGALGIRLTDVRYDPSTGTIGWNVTSTFRDSDGDESYYWTYDYLIVAMSSQMRGTIENNVASNYAMWNNGENMDETDLTWKVQWLGTGYSDFQHYVLLPQGWQLEIPAAEINDPEYLGCEAVNDDIDVSAIAVNLLPWLDSHGLFAYPDIKLARYAIGCEKQDNGDYLNRAWRTTPRFIIDYALITWDGGGLDVYPPDSWLNGGAGWHCDCDARYELRKWTYYVNPSLFESR